MELPPTASLSALQLLLSGAAAAVSWLVVARLLRAAPAGARLGVEKSNLADEFEHGVNGAGEWKVKSLWIYPVKSCKGIEVDQANVVSTGFEHDRQFMFAELKPPPQPGAPAQWVFITQRNYPLMALITTAIHTPPKHPGTLTITFPLRHKTFSLRRPHTRSIRLPLSAPHSSGPLTPVKIWRDTPLAHNVSAPIATELHELAAFLGTKNPLALFRASPDNGLRDIFRNAPSAADLGRQPVVAFADSYPLHLLNIASVREVNGRIADKIPALSAVRFRANIIVSGPRAFHEDDWTKIELGGKLYYCTNRTVRCKLPNVDPTTGEKHPQEPDRTLRTYRNIDAGSPHNACLGMQLVPAGEMGVLRVGDAVRVVETGGHRYVPMFS